MSRKDYCVCPVCGEECTEWYMHLGSIIACENCYDENIVCVTAEDDYYDDRYDFD